jgi:hypothetical protein
MNRAVHIGNRVRERISGGPFAREASSRPRGMSSPFATPPNPALLARAWVEGGRRGGGTEQWIEACALWIPRAFDSGIVSSTHHQRHHGIQISRDAVAPMPFGFEGEQK